MKKNLKLAAGAVLALCCLCPQAIARDAADVPVLFAEGSISVPGVLGLTFTPDGRTAYFGRFGGPEKRWVILESRLEGGTWTPPQAAKFSREHHDAGPSLSPDGKRMFFWSLRPQGDTKPKEARLWVVERTRKGWGEPRDLGDPINGPTRPSANPGLSSNGTLYFVTKGEDALGYDDIYLARPKAGGGYERLENLGAAVNSPQHELDVYIAPDESYILFSSNRPGGQGRTDLYLSTRTQDGWTPAKNLGPAINSADGEVSPCVSPDGRYLFFTRMGGTKPGIYRMDAASAGIPRRR